MFAKALLTATVIGAVTAQIPAIAKRDFLENRQVDGLDIDPACQSALISVSTLFDSAPTPPADLADATLPSDPCATPSFTGKLQSEYSAYTSSAFQWYSSNSDELLSFFTVCSGVVGDAATSGLPLCSTDLGGLGSAPATTTPAQTTGSRSGSGSGSSPTITGMTSSGAGSSTAASGSGSPSATSTPNAAPRETGFVFAAAVAAAGFMGAVAAL
ncbi:hypothetical protein F4801DRAFT_102804 [Xylaria longipes]|nr:hypothetical protein F4801DRAFT_102804 [Xylaria longipes]